MKLEKVNRWKAKSIIKPKVRSMLTSDFYSVINTFQVPVFLLEPNGYVIFANRSATKKFALSTNSKGINFFDLVYEEANVIDEKIAMWMRSRSPLPSRISFKSGSDVDFECICKGNIVSPKSSERSAMIMVQCDDKGISHRKFLSLNKKINQLNKEVRERRLAEGDVRRLNKELESRVEERTKKLRDSNEVLSRSLKELKSVQEQLIRSERLVSLGSMVAGVAHEINNPVGVCVTAASFLNEQVARYRELYDDSELTRQDFESFLDVTSESSTIIVANLDRASNLVRSFKQLAVDQTSDELRELDMKQYLEELLFSLEPYLKQTTHKFVLECPSDIRVCSYPGAIGQIVYNFVNNSIIHGFEGVEDGVIKIQVNSRAREGNVIITYSDNGNGIPKESHKQIFDPFFTTKRNQGGSGLGLNVVYNLVTDKLHGMIEFDQENTSGAVFSIKLPLKIDTAVS